MVYVIYPYLENARDGSFSMRPHAPIPYLKVIECKSMDEARSHKRQQEKYSPPDSVLVIEGKFFRDGVQT